MVLAWNARFASIHCIKVRLISSTSRSTLASLSAPSVRLKVVERLANHDHHIFMAEAKLPDDRSAIVPVAYKVSHELYAPRDRFTAYGSGL